MTHNLWNILMPEQNRHWFKYLSLIEEIQSANDVSMIPEVSKGFTLNSPIYDGDCI